MKNTHHLSQWLARPAVLQYLGRAAAMKLEILAVVITDTGSLAEIARRHSVTRQAAGNLARKARAAMRKQPG